MEGAEERILFGLATARGETLVFRLQCHHQVLLLPQIRPLSPQFLRSSRRVNSHLVVGYCKLHRRHGNDRWEGSGKVPCAGTGCV